MDDETGYRGLLEGDPLSTRPRGARLIVLVDGPYQGLAVWVVRSATACWLQAGGTYEQPVALPRPGLTYRSSETEVRLKYSCHPNLPFKSWAFERE